MQITLQVRYAARAVRPPAAWYLAGDSAAVWLEEICRWPIAHEPLRLHLMPRDRESRVPGGVLVTAGAELANTAATQGVPFGLVAQRLYLPVNAQFDPPITDAELSDLLDEGVTYVWHPALGLVAFEPAEVLRLEDLLTAPAADSTAWNLADPGIAFARRLTTLTPDHELTLAQIFARGQEDIGTRSDELLELPPSPQEPSRDPLSKAQAKSMAALARLARWLTARVPRNASHPTWVNSLEDWANQRLASFQRNLETERFKEIARLMHLLEVDPDQGLRFALPIGGDAARGVATPEGRLGTRDVNFDLRRLGGGRPADPWDLPADYQLNLITRYRELANREMQLGRHRRAAYIFAELLSDFGAAANTLQAGRHYREAAVLYRDRLKRPLEAAQCLEQGGLWTEAVALLEELGEHEKAGDLHRRLEQPDLAEAAYRRAVEQHRTHGDFIAGARVCEVKLQAPDEALAELARGWPEAPQGLLCLRETFQLLGRHGRHAASRAEIKQLRDGSFPTPQASAVVGLLADLATSYPDERTRDSAADTTRVLVAQQLPTAAPARMSELLGALRRLAPEDRLLARDCHRYQRQSSGPPKLSPPRRSTGSNKKLYRLRTVQFGNSVTWRAATIVQDVIYAAGFQEDRLVLARCGWEGLECEHFSLGTFEPRHTASRILLAPCRTAGRDLFLQVVGAESLSFRHAFAPTPEFPDPISVGGLPGISPQVIAAASATTGMLWLLEARDGHLTLVALGPAGELVSTEGLTLHDDPARARLDDAFFSGTLHARGDKVYVGGNEQLLILNRAKLPQTIELPQPINSLVGAAPHTRTRIAASFDQGGMLLWDDASGITTAAFASEMSLPVVGFNRGGYLIAVNSLGCEVYSTQRGQLTFQAQLDAQQSLPFAILPAPQLNRFAILSRDGELRDCELR